MLNSKNKIYSLKNYKLVSAKTKYLPKNYIRKICNLKNSFWKYNIKSQLKWFEENVKKLDIHNCIFLKSKIIGYTLLRRKNTKIGKKRYQYLLIDTVIISQKFRKKKISKILMELNNNIIKKNKKVGILFCQANLVNFYKKFSWKIIRKPQVKIKRYDNLNCMIYSFNKSFIKNNYF
tara:strand:- start:245 stop:775 length:531 start_codon:yes stop_codon:yes gene_type:complete